MAKYSAYQRAMLSDSARTARSSELAARNSANIEQQIYQSRVESAVMNRAILENQREIEAATRANNQLLAQQLRVQAEQLEVQKREAERRIAEESKRDDQMFAMWRQTPDGQAFVQWYGVAMARIQAIRGADKSWRTEVEAARTEWMDAHRSEIPPVPVDRRDADRAIAKNLFIGAGVVFVIYLIAMAAGVIGIVNGLLLLIVLGLLGGGTWMYVDRNANTRAAAEQARTQALARLSQQGHAELGFDPMSDVVPPWATTNAMAYADALEATIVKGYTAHPAASALPQVESITLAAPDSVRSPRLQSWLGAEQ